MDNISATPRAQVQSETFRDFLISAVRCGRLRVQLLQSEFDAIGTALTAGLVSSETAIAWLDEVGGLPFVDIGIEGAQ